MIDKAMPIAWGYCRVSGTRQEESGLSLSHQVDELIRYAAWKQIDLGPKTIVDIGGQKVESRERLLFERVSAFKVTFRKRECGGHICRSLREGDHIIIPKIDRGFRDTADCLTQIQNWEKHGITIHLLDFSVDTSTATGKFGLTIIAGMAEFESRKRSERMKAAHAASRRRGKPIAAEAPFGYVWSTDDKASREMLPNFTERQLMRVLTDWNDKGHPTRQLHAHLRDMGIRRERPLALARQYGIEYSEPAIRRMIKMQRQRDADGLTWDMGPPVDFGTPQPYTGRPLRRRVAVRARK